MKENSQTKSHQSKYIKIQIIILKKEKYIKVIVLALKICNKRLFNFPFSCTQDIKLMRNKTKIDHKMFSLHSNPQTRS